MMPIFYSLITAIFIVTVILDIASALYTDELLMASAEFLLIIKAITIIPILD